MDLHDHILKRSIIFSSRVFQSPVIIKWSTNKRTSHIAAHGDGDIRFWNIRNQLRILRLLHVDAIKLLHQPHGILIDLRLGFRSGRIAFKHVGRQCFAQCLRNLAAAGVMDTDKCNFFELAVAVAVALFGTTSPAALATTVGVLTEVPVMLFLVKIANKTKGRFPA